MLPAYKAGVSTLNRNNEHKIVQQKNNLTTLIHIINYSAYQAGNTTDEPQTNPNKNEKKGKKKTYGEFHNVLLTDSELKKLKDKFNGTTENRIEKLSAYMKSKGKKYRSHYATIINWANRDQPTAPVDQSEAAATTMRKLHAKLN